MKRTENQKKNYKWGGASIIFFKVMIYLDKRITFKGG